MTFSFKIKLFFLAGLLSLSNCALTRGDALDSPSSSGTTVRDIGGNPVAGSTDIYRSSNLNNLCSDSSVCSPTYEELSSDYVYTDDQDDFSASSGCNFDYDPNLSSTFVLNKVSGSVNGLRLLLSKEDLFFLAWVSVRQQINPYFMLGVMSAESRGNCAAVSSSNAEGCFQITNTFGQSQLDDSYLDRVESWYWSDRSGNYYPDSLFVDAYSYFGETPATDQFRLTVSPTSATIDDVDISSIVNFHFGIIGSALYFKWQPYLAFYTYNDIRNTLSNIFQTKSGKATWQAAAYNGGAYGASRAIRNGGEDYLDYMRSETQNYAPTVVDYCTEFQLGEDTYSATYTEGDIEYIIDLLAQTYPSSLHIDWQAVKDDVSQTFFSDDVTELTLVDDIKAVIYVISTHTGLLGPEWPDEGSI